MEIFVIVVFLAAGWFWLDSMHTRELATAVAKRVCAEDGVQFLDDTAAFGSLGLRRNSRGQVMLRRTYHFEFSDTGDNRRKGSIVMVGREIETVYLQPRLVDVAPAFPHAPE